jgi:hypothetical protein
MQISGNPDFHSFAVCSLPALQVGRCHVHHGPLDHEVNQSDHSVREKALQFLALQFLALQFLAKMRKTVAVNKKVFLKKFIRFFSQGNTMTMHTYYVFTVALQCI